MASDPHREPNHSWNGRRVDQCSSIIEAEAIFAAIRRKVQPMAMGRIPPFFLFKATSEAPNSVGQTSTGTFPARIRLTRSVNAKSSLVPASPVDFAVRSFRC